MSVNIVDKSTGNLIKIAGNPIEQASGISYDHTSSGMQANNVQAAVDELKNGLTNVDVALSVPDGMGKNLLPMTVDGIKAANTGITWSGNSTTINNVTFTILTDNDNNVTGIKVDGTANANALFTVQNFSTNGSYIFNGCPANGSENTYRADVRTVSSGSVIAADIGEGTGSSIVISEPIKYVIRINNGCSINNIIFYPMIRPATITDPTFAPYIPSVDARLDAVESGLTKQDVSNKFTVDTTFIENFKAYKINNIVYLSFKIKAQIADNTALITPASDVAIDTYLYCMSSIYKSDGSLFTDGAIWIDKGFTVLTYYGSASSPNTGYVSMSYVTA